MKGQGTMVRFPEQARLFLVLLRVQTGYDVHPGSCFVGVVGSGCVELCCHYTGYMNGRMLRNSMQ